MKIITKFTLLFTLIFIQVSTFATSSDAGNLSADDSLYYLQEQLNSTKNSLTIEQKQQLQEMLIEVSNFSHLVSNNGSLLEKDHCKRQLAHSMSELHRTKIDLIKNETTEYPDNRQIAASIGQIVEVVIIGILDSIAEEIVDVIGKSFF